MTASKCILFIYFLLFSFVKSGYKKPRNCTCKFTHTHTEYTLQIHYLYTRIEKREKRFKINRGQGKLYVCHANIRARGHIIVELNSFYKAVFIFFKRR
ncbi:hypothetical protein V6Z12_A08G095700 [Gossypium hirsutum]